MRKLQQKGRKTELRKFEVWEIRDATRPWLRKIYDLHGGRVVINLAAPEGKVIKVLF